MSKWKKVALSEIAESVDYGVTASATQQPAGPKFLRITDIQGGAVNWDTVPWCECDARSAIDGRLTAGDIVFARTGATTGKSYLIRDCPPNAVFASYLIRVRLGASAEPRYVSQFFQTPDYWAQIAKSARGVAQPGVNATTLKAIQVPLPPMAEQRQIAEMLDHVDSLRAKRRHGLAKLDTVTQSLFLDLFGDPGTNPKGWPVRNIGDLLESATYGTSEKAAKTGEFPVLRMNNITRAGEMDFTDLKFMDLDASLHDRFLVRAGDVLFNRTNSAELVGKTGIYRGSNPMAYAGYLIRLRVNQDNDPEFLAAFLNSAYAKNVLRHMCKSIVGMANINATEIQAMKIPQPPLSLQLEFVNRVGEVEKLKAAQRTSLEKINALLASLQHRAFRGEL